MSELSHYYSTFHSEVRCGHHCAGDACRGWFLSEVDTWHECSCNARKGVPHPEADEDELFESEAGESAAMAAAGRPLLSEDSIPF